MPEIRGEGTRHVTTHNPRRATPSHLLIPLFKFHLSELIKCHPPPGPEKLSLPHPVKRNHNLAQLSLLPFLPFPSHPFKSFSLLVLPNSTPPFFKI